MLRCLLLPIAAAAAAPRGVAEIDADIRAAEARLRALREERAAVATPAAAQTADGGRRHTTDASGNDVYLTDGAEGYDFRYYRDNSSDSVARPAEGVTVTQWAGRRNASVGSLAFGSPFMTRLDIGSGASYPAAPYWLRDNTYYVVIEGNATFGAVPSAGGCYMKYSSSGLTAKSGATACIPRANGTGCDFKPDTDVQNDAGGASATAYTKDGCCAACSADPQCKAAVYLPAAAAAGDGTVYSQGDVFWVQAGQPHGPVANVGSGALRVFAVGESSAARWAPEAGAAPAPTNPSTDTSAAVSMSYREADGSWFENPSPHSDACMANGGVQNMGFSGSSDAPPVLRVRWAGSCQIPYHYHPTGALYFVQYGTMLFKGDYVSYDPTIVATEARWVRPGFDYGPEYNDDKPMQITVLGTDSPPTFAEPPQGPFKVQQTREMTHVWDNSS